MIDRAGVVHAALPRVGGEAHAPERDERGDETEARVGQPRGGAVLAQDGVHGEQDCVQRRQQAPESVVPRVGACQYRQPVLHEQ